MPLPFLFALFLEPGYVPKFSTRNRESENAAPPAADDVETSIDHNLRHPFSSIGKVTLADAKLNGFGLR
ncbi:hypothetical protein Nepgr_029346 [Nepenthes gracilis]|uniref:Uncharacterized protein n=1 Tax=Nepenthes gracilis TaxID=150966 RepID=A0AAD3TE17_NEPGR|nr:hypothetical protein Nepgr_029346 [Nepenthes gracilis]